MKRRQREAFTLLEVSIALAAVALLVAILLPQLLKAQTRSRIAGVRSDMRGIGAALEAYRAEYDVYPPAGLGLGAQFRPLRRLTTPTAFLPSVPTDPFRPKARPTEERPRVRPRSFDYGATPLAGATVWALASFGPDRRDDTSPFSLYPGYSLELLTGQREGYDYLVYDASNGTISRGDIIHASDSPAPQ